MVNKRKTSAEKNSSKQNRNKRNRNPEDKSVQLGESGAKRIDPSVTGIQGSDNQDLATLGSDPVSASGKINQTARIRERRTLAPQMAAANNNVQDTVQPMEVTPAKDLIQGSEPSTATDVANRTASVRERRSLARQATSSNSVVDNPARPLEDTLAPVSNPSEWAKLVRAYEAEIEQRADNVCISCGGLFYRSAVAGLNLETIADKFGGSFLTNVTPATAHSSGLACATCLASIRSGKVPKLCLSNGLAFPDVPDILKVYPEKTIISKLLYYVCLYENYLFNFSSTFLNWRSDLCPCGSHLCS